MSLEERAVQARAVEHGHPKVAEHEIVLAHGDSIDGLLAVEHDLRFEAPLTKDLAERFGDLMFVLDHQNSQAGPGFILSRIAFGGAQWARQRKLDRKGRAAIRRVRYGNFSAVGTNDARTQRKPDAGAFSQGLRGEEGIEDAGADIGGNARAVVGNREAGAQVRAVIPGADPQDPLPGVGGKSLPSVDD